MFRAFLDALKARLRPDPAPVDHLPRLQALEAAQQSTAEAVSHLTQLLEETEELHAKMKRAMGRLYAMKRWDDVEDAPSEEGNGKAAVNALLLRIKHGRRE